MPEWASLQVIRKQGREGELLEIYRLFLKTCEEEELLMEMKYSSNAVGQQLDRSREWRSPFFSRNKR